MSAVPLRAPARWTDAVRAELRILVSARHLGWIALFLFMAFGMGGGERSSGRDAPFAEFRTAVLLMFLLPLAWQGRGGREPCVALPVGDGTREGVRVLCGAAFAGTVLALGLAIYVSMARWLLGEDAGRMDVFPRGYPVALTLAGMANYLLGAALMLRSRRPGRTLAATLLLALLALSAAGIQLERVEFRVDGPWGDRRYSGGTSLTLTAALARLALGACLVCAAARMASLRLPGWQISRPRALRRGSTAPMYPRAVVTGIRAPAPLAMVFARQVRLLGPRMLLPVLVAAYGTWVAAPHEPTVEIEGRRFLSAAPLNILWYVAFMWPALVWMDEQGDRAWDEAHPVHIPAHRLLHAAAGLVWLQAVGLVMVAAYLSWAVQAGMVTSAADVPAWIWLGLPIAVVGAYCLGTVPVMLSGAPVLTAVLYGIWFPFLTMNLWLIVSFVAGGGLEWAVDHPMPLLRPFAPMDWATPDEWSAANALLWTALYVAAAVWAIRRRARQEREEHAWPPPEKPAVPPNLWYGGRRRGLA